MSTTGAELSARLDELDISAAELAAILRVRPETVDGWLSGDTEPSAESRVLLRLIMDPDRSHAAKLAAERVRGMKPLPVRGTGDWQAAAAPEPPYGGGHRGTTGTQPSGQTDTAEAS